MKLLKFKRPFIIVGTLAIIGTCYLVSDKFYIKNENISYAESNKPLSPYLSCPVVKERIRDFLKYHYVFRSFDTELSKRTFSMYFKILDPGKLYFYQSDIDHFKAYESVLGKKINSIDCRFISEVYNIYKTRIQESTAITNDIMKKPFDFSKNEFIQTDRKKIDWAKNTNELKDRWRKTVKFVVLNMKNITDNNNKTIDRLKRRYQIIQKDTIGRSVDDINSIFLNAFALSLDPHSSFFTPLDNQQFNIDFSLKLVGIGATLISPDGYTTIDAIVPGGAAAKDGRLKKGDKIIGVDSGDGGGMQDVIDMELDKVVQLIRGKENTKVKLLVMRKNSKTNEVARFPIELMRAIVQIKDSEAKSDVIEENGKKIGVINFPSFYIDYKGCQKDPDNCRSSANDMAREINKLTKKDNVNGIVIDLRRNGGGDLNEAEKIVGLFIDNPVVTQVEDRNGQVRPLEADSKAIYRGPLAILVSKYTASASEILAGAVQDYGRGLILGDSRTFGKGTVQTVIEIPGTENRITDGAIHVTIAKFFRPSGKSNQEKGVLSDVVIPDILDATNTGESEYDYELPYTTIKPSRVFKAEQDLSSIIPELKKNSALRIDKSSKFKEILSAMKKAQDDKNSLLSLKEDEKIGNKKVTKKSTLNPNPNDTIDDGLDDLPDFSIKVIRKNDIDLQESISILIDSIVLLKGKINWIGSSEDNNANSG